MLLLLPHHIHSSLLINKHRNIPQFASPAKPKSITRPVAIPAATKSSINDDPPPAAAAVEPSPDAAQSTKSISSGQGFGQPDSGPENANRKKQKSGRRERSPVIRRNPVERPAVLDKTEVGEVGKEQAQIENAFLLAWLGLGALILIEGIALSASDRNPLRSRNRRQSASTEKTGSYADPLFLSNSDHPGAQLVSNPFNGTNFHSWNHKVRVALGAKRKLGFITGLTIKPDKDTDDYDRWERCDFMVLSWLSNSMIPEIADNFLHVTSARALWDEITEQYAESNRPLVYQLQKELVNIRQDNMTVSAYYNRMKKVWDSLQTIDSLPLCECDALTSCTCVLFKRLMDRESSIRVMQFLMGLSDQFEQLRSHILSLEPLPNLNKTYHMVLQVERQKGMTMTSPMQHDALAMNRSYSGHKTPSSGYAPTDKRDVKRSKVDRHCDYCHEAGHLKESCFKLVGYPDWWKGPKPPGSTSTPLNPGKVMANVQDLNSYSHPLEFDVQDSKNVRPDPSLINAVVQEVIKAFNERNGADGAGPSTVMPLNYSGPYN